MKKIIILSFLLIACSTAKKTERLDNRAVERVSANIDLLNKVGVKWEKIHPLIAGAYRETYIHDTTIIKQPPKIILDEMRVKFVIDSINAIKDSIGDSIKDKINAAYNLGVDYAENYYRSIPRPHTVDTVKKETPDLRHEGILNDSIHNQAVTIGTQKGIIEQLEKENKSLTWKIWIMVVIILLLGVIMGMLIKAKIL